MTAVETSELLYGPSFSALRQAAFDRSADRATEGIRRILYIESNDRATTEVETAWAAEHPSLALEVTTLDDVVEHCYEQLFGVATTLGRQQRLRLIEQALIEVDDTGMLEGAPALLDEFSQIFAAVEAAGISTADDLQQALDDTTLPDRIQTPTVAAYENFLTLRDQHTPANTQPRSERIAAVAAAEEPLQSCYPSVDVVIIADHRSLPSVEYNLLERLATEFGFIATLPAVHESLDGRGTDADVADVFAAYQAMGCEPDYIPPTEASKPLHDLTQQLYVLGDRDGDIISPPPTLEWHEAPTSEREVRHVARKVRAQLSNGTDPEEIAVVVPGLITYREQLADSFEAYDIPYVSYANKLLQQTYVGEAVLQILELTTTNPSADTLVDLVSNPLVALEEIDPSAVAAMNRRLPSQDCGTLLTELAPADGANRLEAFLADCKSLREPTTTPEEAVDDLEALIEQLGIADQLEACRERGDRTDVALEHRTLAEIDSALDSIVALAEEGLVDAPVDRIDRAVSDLRISAPRQDATGRVELLGLLDARGKSFDHLYLVGATAAALPASPQRPLFFDALEDVVPTLQTTPHAVVESDPQLDARYQFGTLLSSATTAHITTPDASVDDEDVLPSPVLGELSHVTGLDPTEPMTEHGAVEDLQRTLARYDSAALSDAVAACEATGDLSAEQATRVRQGVKCADHRGKTALTDHDGHLDPETVEAVFPAAKLQRLSPSRLKGYTQCGFAYYMNRGLGLSAPDAISPEPDNLILGDFIHDTLELFYTRLQEQPGEPVDITGYDRATLENKLLTAATDVEETLDLPYESAFYTTWKSHLLAGLADPDSNDHYNSETTEQPAPETAHSQQDRGFFVRFLEQEYERETPLLPAWFETPVGFDQPAETFDLSLPNGTTVTLSGRIDRVDIAPDPIATPGSIFDYKTGSTNLARTVDGVEFQLPLYALAARRGIAAATSADPADLTVDAHFYDIDVPDGASWKGPLSERVGDGPTDPAYTAFLDDLTLQRVQQIDDGITEGAFHPSVLGADEAGCKHCDYLDICDVRHHDRYDVIEHIDATDATAYVADRARERAVTDRLPGGDAE